MTHPSPPRSANHLAVPDQRMRRSTSIQGRRVGPVYWVFLFRAVVVIARCDDRRALHKSFPEYWFRLLR
jgi:hypothetical protein